jgi:hypothetical protein
MFFVAFSVFLTGAIYISPMFCGSPTEKKLLSKPQEIDSGERYLQPLSAVMKILRTMRLKSLSCAIWC